MLCVNVLYWTTVHPMQVYIKHAFNKNANGIMCKVYRCPVQDTHNFMN